MDRVERVANEIAQAVVSSESREVRRKVRTVVSATGSRRRGSSTQRLREELRARGIYFTPDFTERAVQLDAWVRFGLEHFPPQPSRSLSEKEMEVLISRDPSIITDAFPRLGGLELLEGGVAGQSVTRQGARQVKMDLVFTREDGSLVVCELKRGRPGRGAANQLADYVRLRPKARIGILITMRPENAAVRELVFEELAVWKKQKGLDLRWLWFTPPELTVAKPPRI